MHDGNITDEWVLSHISKSHAHTHTHTCVWHICTHLCVTHMYTHVCYTQVHTCTHMCVTHMYTRLQLIRAVQSCLLPSPFVWFSPFCCSHTSEWVMSHKCLRWQIHAAANLPNEKKNLMRKKNSELVMSHIWMTHVTHMYAMTMLMYQSHLFKWQS